MLTLGLAVGLGAVLRLWLCFHDDGIYWPDEIYQSFEPAHRLVFGYGMQAWEFIDGARNWLFPGLLAGVLRICAIVGISTPAGYIHVTKVLTAALSLSAAPGAYALAQRLGAGRLPAAVGASLWALAAPAIYFAPRALTETCSAAPVIWGFALALGEGRSRRERWAGAFLLGLSTVLRLQNGIFCLALLGAYGVQRQRRWALEALVVLAACAMALGALDWVTWGAPFHSAVVYLRFNLVEGKAALWGTAGFGYYVRVLWDCMPTVAVALAVFAPLAWRRAPVLLGAAVAFLLLHMEVPHKELRFILPVLPLLCALAGVGLSAAAERVPGYLLEALVLALGLVSALGYHDLTFGQLGAYEDAKPQASAYDDFGAVNRLLMVAHELPDLCGLKVEAVNLAWAGGQTYLHRDVPLYSHLGPPRGAHFYSHVLTVRGHEGGTQVVAQEGPFELVRLFDGPCVANPNYSWRLP